ncbi:MAG: hypothetical protein VB078_00080 [Clostridiaceae bacterium]|nr:hypothetical protein [Clostridiaceae bacterium]DAM37340.1 MAG TPA: dimeris T4 recombination endonuclease VII [Caudoviricetes sp.]
MKKIKITVGTFGYKPEGASSVLLKDADSEPFDVSDAVAERLLKKKIAELAEEAPDVVVSYDDKMTKAQLIEIGTQVGVELTDAMTKKAMLAALDAAIAATDATGAESAGAEDPDADGDGDDDGEAPPAVKPADPAQ